MSGYFDEQGIADGLQDVRDAGAEAASSVDALSTSMARSRGVFEELVRSMEQGTGRLRTRWRQTIDELLIDLTRWLDAMQNQADGLAFGGGSGGLGGLGAVTGILGMLGRKDRPPRVQFSHPTVERPAGTILPGTLATLADRTDKGVQVTLSQGAVQIITQTVDDAALSRAADVLAQEIHARLAFEDQRSGRG